MIVSPLCHRIVRAVNEEPRRNGRAVDLLLLHYTGTATAEAARDLLVGADAGVSCHYLIDEQGVITQMVGEEMRAWHAGVSLWQGEMDTNSRSIGIEIQNPGHALGYRDFPEAQMRAVLALCRDILSRHSIPPRNVLAHSDVAPGRKIDPGERFRWDWLAQEGIGHWVPPVDGDATPLPTEDLTMFQDLLQRYGYGIDVTGVLDDQTRKVTDAFQRHFRQALVNGVPDVSCLRTAERLALGLSA